MIRALIAGETGAPGGMSAARDPVEHGAEPGEDQQRGDVARGEAPERLLQPALLILPVYLFMLVERGLGGSEAPVRLIRNYGLTLAAVAGVALAARIGIHAAGADYCRTACRDLIPAADLAAGLRKAGFSGRGTVVVRDIHLGGNLRVQLPERRQDGKG